MAKTKALKVLIVRRYDINKLTLLLVRGCSESQKYNLAFAPFACRKGLSCVKCWLRFNNELRRTMRNNMSLQDTLTKAEPVLAKITRRRARTVLCTFDSRHSLLRVFFRTYSGRATNIDVREVTTYSPYAYEPKR